MYHLIFLLQLVWFIVMLNFQSSARNFDWKIMKALWDNVIVMIHSLLLLPLNSSQFRKPCNNTEILSKYSCWNGSGIYGFLPFWSDSALLPMESLAQLEAMCERLYNSQDSAERAHAENSLRCFSVNTEYISQCQYILDNSSKPYSLMLASSSLLKQVTDHTLPLNLRLDISKLLLPS